ncbi:hypothetical protein NEOKW01_0850 [Nematocida sp. AWRm80]|nr:hypothetical protein NEOKW01_0850 [Nematocida sp. AWRm80]
MKYLLWLLVLVKIVQCREIVIEREKISKIDTAGYNDTKTKEDINTKVSNNTDTLLNKSIDNKEVSKGVLEETIKAKDLRVVNMTISYSFGLDKKEKDINVRIALFTKQFPITTLNFIRFCNGGLFPVPNKKEKQQLGYKGCIFHRIVPGFVLQGGDILNKNGTGSVSAVTLDGRPFKDEKDQLEIQKIPSVRRVHKNTLGVVAMANAGPNTNGSQFYITLTPTVQSPDDITSQLDGKHTVFGRVISGMKEILEMTELYRLVSSYKPFKAYIKEIIVTDNTATEEEISKVPNILPIPSPALVKDIHQDL